jgi:hypothetical protein
VALEYLLKEGNEIALADKVAEVIRQRRLEVHSWATAEIPDVGEEIP